MKICFSHALCPTPYFQDSHVIIGINRQERMLNMTAKPVAKMTVEELKILITSVIDEHLSAIKTSIVQDISDLITNREKTTAYVLPKLTEAEKQKRYEDLREMFRRWDEEDDEEEQRETFEYLQKVLDEDRLSNRPLFPQK
jgi:hypothetical protein